MRTERAIAEALRSADDHPPSMTEPSGGASTEADAERRGPRGLLERAGVRGDPRRDQHFLVDGRVLDRIVGYADPFDRSHVLEIGAGTGGLTDRLLAAAGRVTT